MAHLVFTPVYGLNPISSSYSGIIINGDLIHFEVEDGASVAIQVEDTALDISGDAVFIVVNMN